MLPRAARALVLINLLALAAALLTGCFLQNMFGRVIIVEDIEDEVNEIIANVFGNGTAAVCYVNGMRHMCTYIVDGEIITSSAYLVSEFGLYGVLLDPLILQVPSDVMSVTAFYTPTTGGGGAQAAPVSVRSAFEASPGLPITAQQGTKFLIIEFQPGITSSLEMTYPVNGKPFDYSLNFVQRKPISQTVEPVRLKAMLTGKVVVNGHMYYAPFLPCTTSFASIPTLTIPITTTFVNLQPQIGDAIRLGQAQPCAGVVYDYSNAPPPLDKSIYLPIIAR